MYLVNQLAWASGRQKAQVTELASSAGEGSWQRGLENTVLLAPHSILLQLGWATGRLRVASLAWDVTPGN